MTLDELIADRDELLKHRASGVRTVEMNSGLVSRRVEFRSDADMANAIADIERRIAEFGSGSRPTTIRFATSKG